MDSKLLTDLGLTHTQAITYLLLLKKGPGTPPLLAKQLGESRTNTYNVLEKLVELSLVRRFEKDKKFTYQAEPPTALEKLAQTQRDVAMQQERQLHAALPSLLSEYFSSNEQPGVRYYQGEKELKDIYLDQIKTGEPIYIIRPNYNMDIYDFDFMSELRHMARKAKINRFAITPDRAKAPANYKDSDPFMLLNRTWINPEDYTAPVEWNAYGNKLAVMSFGNEAIGMIIESPQIAESFRQLYKLLDQGIKQRPDYAQLPKHAKYIGATSKSS